MCRVFSLHVSKKQVECFFSVVGLLCGCISDCTIVIATSTAIQWNIIMQVQCTTALSIHTAHIALSLCTSTRRQSSTQTLQTARAHCHANLSVDYPHWVYRVQLSLLLTNGDNICLCAKRQMMTIYVHLRTLLTDTSFIPHPK